jgi:hypothetical protein
VRAYAEGLAAAIVVVAVVVLTVYRVVDAFLLH